MAALQDHTDALDAKSEVLDDHVFFSMLSMVVFDSHGIVLDNHGIVLEAQLAILDV
jgi:hypothetical protein